MNGRSFVACAQLLLVSEVATAAPDELTELDFSSMMKMEVTTASKQAQSISEVAAPIYVITADDMRRVGAGSIPEALRLAPGVVLGQIDPGKWFVSLRGFAWEFSNKALILLDGRAVHSPLNSSVYWNTLDVPMEDIERIEVIRGPGDARWGSHAVNGIINIITRPAADVRGASASATLDTDATQKFTARYGDALSSSFDYRAYVKYLSQGDYANVSGDPGIGERTAMRAGLRLDGVTQNGDRLTFIGDVQSGRDGSLLVSGVPAQRFDADEWSALARWEHGAEGQLRQQAQFSFDHLTQAVYEERDTLDFAYQTELPEWRSQTWTFGAVYKRSSDELPPGMAIEPAEMTQNTYGAFIHDRIALGPHYQLLLGSQFEHNRFTGWEMQPNVQFIHTHDQRHTFWASVSRAVRAPLRTEDGFALDIPIAPGTVIRNLGNRDLEAESVLSWQAGTRLAFNDNLFVDLTAFYNEYEDLILQRAGAPFFDPMPPPGQLVLPSVYTNAASGHTKGFEGVVKARPLDRVTLQASYSLYSQTPWTDPLGYGSVAAVEHQLQAHSSTTLTPTLEWNVDLYYVGPLSPDAVDSYYKLDSQLAWTPLKNLEVAVGIRNALDDEHVEAGLNTVDAVTVIPRTGYLRVLKKF
jgi:iron complex outermembrane receptor protein